MVIDFVNKKVTYTCDEMADAQNHLIEMPHKTVPPDTGEAK